jgi:hypothetical protein
MMDGLKKAAPIKKGIYIVLLMLVAVAGAWVYRWMKIDSCLDLGGRWDYTESRCER